MDSESNGDFTSISKREYDILEGIVKGLSQKEIADKLNISSKTVDNHISNIKKKLGVTKNTEMIGYYVATLRGKKFNLDLLHKFGISIFFILVHVCTLSE